MLFTLKRNDIELPIFTMLLYKQPVHVFRLMTEFAVVLVLTDMLLLHHQMFACECAFVIDVGSCLDI